MKLSNWDLSYNNLYMHKKQYIYENTLNPKSTQFIFPYIKCSRIFHFQMCIRDSAGAVSRFVLFVVATRTFMPVVSIIRLPFCACGTVSYTHLDVYKRQGINRDGRIRIFSVI